MTYLRRSTRFAHAYIFVTCFWTCSGSWGWSGACPTDIVWEPRYTLYRLPVNQGPHRNTQATRHKQSPLNLACMLLDGRKRLEYFKTDLNPFCVWLIMHLKALMDVLAGDWHRCTWGKLAAMLVKLHLNSFENALLNILLLRNYWYHHLTNMIFLNFYKSHLKDTILEWDLFRLQKLGDNCLYLN